MTRDIQRRIEQYKEGQWFLYDDKDESKEKIARIKLILNWRDTERLLFTNHNRRKALHMTYAELAGYLSADTVKPLNPRAGSMKPSLLHTADCGSGRSATEEKRDWRSRRSPNANRSRRNTFPRERPRWSRHSSNTRNWPRQNANAPEVLRREKAERKRQAASDAVGALKVEAWMKLPIMEGTLTPCRLVAIIAGSDKYIFANRAGIKVAEYTASQLANLIVTENSEILDTGAEFENVLASVVTGLREDRHKSYDELTGDTV
ncbi:MAG: DUF1631 family protein [Gammaproteobacteria bacterium]|nr:DUF1631 family protein [Gammaproteobacteria bacterium]